MALLKNTNAHAVRMTGKVGRNITVWNIPPQGEVEVPGDGLGAPRGVVVVQPKAQKKAAPKKAKKAKKEEAKVEEPKTDK